MPQGIASDSENEVAICFHTGFCLKPGTWNLKHNIIIYETVTI